MKHLQTARHRPVDRGARLAGDGIDRSRANYVPAPIRREAPALPIEAEIVHTIDAAPNATQHIEMKTSAVDRAQGFLIASVPMYALFGTAVVALCVLGWNVPLYSLATLTIFTLAFLAAWVVGYAWTLHVSAEGVSLYEAKQKWAIIEREQRERWAAWHQQNGVRYDEFE